MKSFIYLLLLIFLTIATEKAFAQKNKDSAAVLEKPRIALIAKAYGDSIALRWGATTPLAWEHCNKSGFVLERFTVYQNGKLVQGSREKKVMTTSPIKPFTEAQWTPLTDKEELALMYAQALYGETFELKGKQNDMMSMINQSRELDNRYSFALLAADQSTTIAKAAGLFFTDKTIKKGERYVYRIYPAIPKQGYIIDTGFVYIDPTEIVALPKIRAIKAEFGDRIINLSWNRKYFERVFTTYVIERSEDKGKIFKRLTQRPIINLTPEGRPAADDFYAVDSLPENDKLYVFRARGINPFGELGPPSDTVQGMGIEKTTAVTPVVYKAEPLPDGSIVIKWLYADSLNKGIKGFIVTRTSMKKNDSYKDVTALLPVTTREYKDLKPLKAGYYIVKAVDPKGRPAFSFPIMGQLRDSIPPLPPIGIKGLIDSTGVVKLSWKSNKEDDILGYRIFFSNSLNDEFTQVTKSAIPDSFYTDTVSIQTLTKKVFYKLVALDLHFNPSKFSEIVEIKRPDIIPPSAPVLSELTSVSEGILVKWIPSSSSDVVAHVLYRKLPSEKNWITIAVVDTSNLTREFLDKGLVKGKEYEYTMIAVDDSKLESELIRPIRIAYIDNKIRPAIAKFKFTLDTPGKKVQLRWEYNEKNIQRFTIYKCEKGTPMRIYKSLPAGSVEFSDKTLSPNTTYLYRIRAIFIDGSSTEFSKELEVSY